MALPICGFGRLLMVADPKGRSLDHIGFEVQPGRVLQETAGGRRHLREGLSRNAAARRLEAGVPDGFRGHANRAHRRSRVTLRVARKNDFATAADVMMVIDRKSV